MIVTAMKIFETLSTTRHVPENRSSGNPQIGKSKQQSLQFFAQTAKQRSRMSNAVEC